MKISIMYDVKILDRRVSRQCVGGAFSILDLRGTGHLRLRNSDSEDVLQVMTKLVGHQASGNEIVTRPQYFRRKVHGI